MPRILLALLLAQFVLLGAPTASAQVAQALPTVRLTAGMHVITAEFANTDPARTRGLMYREALPGNQGMLFDFERPSIHCMWMRNTLIPLSVAFIADDGTIVNIEDMAPRTEDSHCARQPVRWALEMSKGWFAQRGLKAGSRIQGLPTR